MKKIVALFFLSLTILFLFRCDIQDILSPGSDLGTISGRVYYVFSNEKPVSRLTVFLWNLDNGPCPSPWEGKMDLGKTKRTDENGKYRFASLTPGEYVLFCRDVYTHSYFDPEKNYVSLKKGQTVKNVDFCVKDKGY